MLKNVDYENVWTLNGEPFTSDDIGDYIGFVYLITDSFGKKYVGKKIFKSKRRLPPLKGKTRKRTKIVESNWREYYGSSDSVNESIEKYGKDGFKREILHLCMKKGEMGYLELFEQVSRNVLLDDEYYNGIIQAKIHRSHIQGLKELWQENKSK